MSKSNILLQNMLSRRDESQVAGLMRFFKTGEGDYGYGDKFLGLKNPQTRSFVKKYQDLDMEEIQTLVDSEYHEVRLCGFLILVEKYQKLIEAFRHS